MAAFINALSEEGTREEVLHWVLIQREENGMITLSPEFYSRWTKTDLLYELSELWDKRK